MTQTVRSYSALIYPVARHGAHRVSFRAECVQYPGIVAERETPNDAIEGLRESFLPVIAAGATETTGDIVMTTITVSKQDGKGEIGRHAYTAVVTPDTDGEFAAFCPALGVATDGRSLAEALAMLEDAANLYLQDQPLPVSDVQVIIEQLTIPMPDVSADASMPASPVH